MDAANFSPTPATEPTIATSHHFERRKSLNAMSISVVGGNGASRLRKRSLKRGSTTIPIGDFLAKTVTEAKRKAATQVRRQIGAC